MTLEENLFFALRPEGLHLRETRCLPSCESLECRQDHRGFSNGNPHLVCL